MTNKLVVIINGLKVAKIKKIVLCEMKFLVPNYSCLQNPWLVGYRPQIPVISVLCPPLNLLSPPTRTKFLGTPLSGWRFNESFKNSKCSSLTWMGCVRAHNPLKKDTRSAFRDCVTRLPKQGVSSDTPLSSNQLAHDAFGDHADILKEGRKVTCRTWVLQLSAVRHRSTPSADTLSRERTSWLTHFCIFKSVQYRRHCEPPTSPCMTRNGEKYSELLLIKNKCTLL